jgi:hypothetical protein
MEATRTILRPYVASMLMVSIATFSIPLAFAFGAHEDVQLPTMFYESFLLVDC